MDSQLWTKKWNVRRNRQFLATAALLLSTAVCPKSYGAEDATPALPKWLQLGATLRVRYEAPSGTLVASSTLDEYLLSRLRLEAQVKPTAWLRFLLQAQDAQDARAFGYNTATMPAAMHNPFDVRLMKKLSACTLLP